MELENLSKEQLIGLLKNKDVDEEINTCKFTSKNTNKKCSEDATTPWGYCNKHKRSMQSKKEERLWKSNEDEDIIENERTDVVNTSGIDYNNPLDSEGVKMYEDINNGNIDSSSQKMFFNTGGGYASNSDLTKLNPKNESSSVPPYEEETPTTKTPSTKNPSKLKKVKKHKTLKIGRNMYGRFEEPRTHLLFDPVTHQVYGVQAQTGNVLPLTPKHYDICRKKGWKFYEYEESDDSESEGDSSDSDDNSEVDSSDSDDNYDVDY